MSLKTKSKGVTTPMKAEYKLMVLAVLLLKKVRCFGGYFPHGSKAVEGQTTLTAP